MKKFLALMSMLVFLCSSFAYAAGIPSAGDDVLAASIMLPYKDISHKWRTINKMKKQAKNLTDDEKAVIKKYVFGAVRGEDTYLLINCHLRGILQDYIPAREITKPLKYRLEYYAKCLSAPIAKTKLPQNMILYRGIDEKGMKYLFPNKNLSNIISKPVSETNLELLKKQIVGETYTEKGFMSTSYDRTGARQTKFMLQVNAPKNLQAVLIEDLGKKQEKEVLINMNTKWKVTDISISSNNKTRRDYYLITIKYVL